MKKDNIKITDLIKKYEEKNGKSLSHLYANELFNFVEEIPENWSESYASIINRYQVMTSSKKEQILFNNLKDSLKRINVVFFDEINKKLQIDKKNCKTTKINFNYLNETPNKFWISKVEDYISETELLLRKILKSNVNNESNYKITMILSNDFSNILKNKLNNGFYCFAKFDNLLQKYNIQCIEHDLLNNWNKSIFNKKNELYQENKNINSNSEKNTILLIITKKQDDFRLQINNKITFKKFKNSLTLNEVTEITTNFNKEWTNLSKAKIFAIQSKIKRTSNYIKYCLEKNDCYGANGCFHFWASKAKYKDKILIYGPNGSGKSSLIKELISQWKMSENLNDQEIMVFDDNFIYKHIYQKGINNENQTELLHHSNVDKEKELSRALEFHTDDLIKLRNKKAEYETQQKQLNNDWKKIDDKLFKLFFEIISDGKNKESLIYEKLIIFWKKYWKKYWKDNKVLTEINYGQKNYDQLKKIGSGSFDTFKKEISNHFQFEGFFNEFFDDAELKNESVNYNLITKNFEKDPLKNIIIECRTIWQWFKDTLPDKINFLQKKIQNEEEKILKELQKELDKIQNKWNFSTKITLKYSKKSKKNKDYKNFEDIKDVKNSKDDKDYSIKIIGKNEEDVIKYLSAGELKSLAIVIFFLYLKRKILKNNKPNSSNKKYLIIFDDVFDELDFATAFKFNRLFKWLSKDFKKKYNKKWQHRPKMMFLTHQFDFITFFHQQEEKKKNQNKKKKNLRGDNEKQKFDFFRLFKEDKKPKFKHTFVSLNLKRLIKTNLMIFYEYFNKMLQQFEKQASNETKNISIHQINLINQIIFWSISKLTIEIILTNQINLQGEKVNLNENCNAKFKKYLNLSNEITKEVEKAKKKISQKNIWQENIWKKNIFKILQKWKPINKTFVFISQKNDKNKICNISQKNVFLMMQAFKELLFEIKVLNQEEKKKIEEKIKFFSNKYKRYDSNVIVETNKKSYTGGLNATIELEVLENRLKLLLEKLCPKINTSKEKTQKENLYIEYVLLQRAIFFLKEAYANKNKTQENNSDLFAFLRHANNNFFPSLLMFDASFEKLLESAEQNKSIITQKITKN